MRDRSRHLRRFYAARRELLDAVGAAVQRSPTDPELATLMPALAHIEQAIAAERQRTRGDDRVVVAAFCITLIFAVVLASALPIPSRLELRGVVTSIQITSTSEQHLTDLLPLSEIGLSGASFTDGGAELDLAGTIPEVQLMAGSAPMNLEPLRISAADRIDISTTPRQGRYRLVIQSGGPISVALSLSGPVTVTRGARQTRDFAIPHQLTATWPAGTSAIITLATTETSLTRPLAVAAVGFTVEEYVAEARKRVSSLRSGEVLFPDVDRAVTLREGQTVSMGGLVGDLRPMLAKDGSLTVAVRGSVGTLDVGEGGAAVSALPSALEYVTRRRDWVASASAIAGLFAMATGLWSWWRNDQ